MGAPKGRGPRFLEPSEPPITTPLLIDYLKRREEAKQLKLAKKKVKKCKTICKHLMPLPNPAKNEVTQEEEPTLLPVPKRRKVS